MKARFNFKVCNSIDMLYENLKGLQSIVNTTKRSIALNQLKRDKLNYEDEALVEATMKMISLG